MFRSSYTIQIRETRWKSAEKWKRRNTTRSTATDDTVEAKSAHADFERLATSRPAANDDVQRCSYSTCIFDRFQRLSIVTRRRWRKLGCRPISGDSSSKRSTPSEHQWNFIHCKLFFFHAHIPFLALRVVGITGLSGLLSRRRHVIVCVFLLFATWSNSNERTNETS